MNTRQELMDKIEAAMDEDTTVIEEIVKDFVDEMERHFGEIVKLLEEVAIDKLDNIEDAMGIADVVGTSLY